jgi:mono/diheme cytochrome c family protein
MFNRYALAMLVILTVSGCAMGEEIKRIDEVKRSQQLREQSRSTNLTGEQIFIRTCNTCHPGGKQGMGPSLEKINEDDMKDDKVLKHLIRSGKGLMPGQPKQVISDQELDALVTYLRHMND